MRSRALVERLRQVWLESATRGESMPGELTLADRLGASRPAIREALVQLEAEGLIRRQVGTSTITNGAALGLAARFDLQHDHEEKLRQAGYDVEVEALDVTWSQLSAHEASLLDTSEGSRVARVVKRWSADGRPAILAINRVLLPDDARLPDGRRSLFRLVQDVHRDVVEWEVAYPYATRLDEERAGWLDVEPGTEALGLELVGVGRSGRRWYLADEHILNGFLRQGFVRSVRA